MTIIREGRGPRLRALQARAAGEGGDDFAERLCAMIESYRDLGAGHWPAFPKPSEARGEAERIMRAAAEVLTATAEASEAVRARLRHHLRECGRDAFDFDTGGASYRALGDLMQAAAAIYRTQPATGRPPDDTRAGFVQHMRQHFAAHGVAWSPSTEGLAAAALAFADGITADAAGKAIARLDKSSAESG